MSDSILERARRLAAAANLVADQMSMQVAEFAGAVQARREDEGLQEQQRRQEADLHSEVERERNAKLFRGAAISGSSLVTTYGDIRQFAPRGTHIVIDGRKVRLADKGEWSSSRIELSEDYGGETNLDCEIAIPNDDEHMARGSPKRVKAKIVPSGEISSAISGLNSIKFPSNSIPVDTHFESSKPKLKKRFPPNERGPLSARSDSSSKPNNNNPPAATDTLSVASHTPAALFAVSPSPQKLPASLATGSKGDFNAELFELSDINTTKMLHEIQLKEEVGYTVHSYANMHRRLADEGHARAQERVEAHRRQQQEALIEARFANVKDDQEPADAVEKRLQHERQKALTRALQKKREDEKRILEKLEKEEKEREERAARMQEKAERLAQITAERVEKLKRDKAQAHQLELERQRAEEERRRESEKRVSQQPYKDKVDKLRLETEKRLERIKYMDEEKKLRDALAADRKLKELAAARGRSVPMSRRDGDDSREDNSSRGSSRPRSVGPGQKSIGHPLPSIRAGSRSVPEEPTILLRSSSGGAAKRSSDQRTKPLLSRPSDEEHPSTHRGEVNDMRMDISRKRTPIQTTRDPTGQRESGGNESDGVSGDSLDGSPKSRARDAMSLVSALTGDDHTSYSELHEPTPGNRRSLIPKPARKKKKKTEVWKMQPIAIKPYVPIPTNT